MYKYNKITYCTDCKEIVQIVNELFWLSFDFVIVGLDPPNPMLNQYISLALAHRGLGNNTGVPQI